MWTSFQVGKSRVWKYWELEFRTVIIWWKLNKAMSWIWLPLISNSTTCILLHHSLPIICFRRIKELTSRIGIWSDQNCCCLILVCSFFSHAEFPCGLSPFLALANINSENHTAQPAHPRCQKQLLPPTNNKENIAITLQDVINLMVASATKVNLISKNPASACHILIRHFSNLYICHEPWVWVRVYLRRTFGAVRNAKSRIARNRSRACGFDLN
jgi:hypothetical protein